MPRKGETKVTSEQFWSIYQVGMTCAEFGRQVGVSQTCAVDIYRRECVPVPPKGRPQGRLDDIQITIGRHQDIIQAIKAGVSHSHIARDRGVSRQAVQQLAQRLSERGLIGDAA